jgi:RNA polymerase sigma-70 factor (ECF subfamily)
MDALFRDYSDDLRRYAYRRLRDREAAADLTQEAFLRYVASRQEERSEARASQFFLWRIAGNLIVDLARRQRRQGRTVPLEQAALLADPAPLADRRLIAREDFATFKTALDGLPPKTRAALLLNRLEGLTHAEIALRLAISPSMVSKHIMKALRVCLRVLEAADA